LRFTVRRPADAEVSACCHRPSGGDVACCVEVGVARPCGAGFALEHRLALAVSGRDVPAHRATLRRVGGRDLLDPTVSFVLQPCCEQTPTTAADAAVETAFLGDLPTGLLNNASRTTRHRPHIQGFDPNRVEAARILCREFLDPILAAVCFSGFEFGDRQLGAGAPIRTALGAGQPLVQHRQSRCLTAGQAGHAQQLPGGQGRGYDAAVDADHRAITWAGNRRRGVSEGQMPAPGPITGDAVGLHTVRHRARAAKSDPTDLGHPHPPEASVELLDVMRFDRDLPESFMYIGFAPGRAPVRATEEIAHRLRAATPAAAPSESLPPTTRVLRARRSTARTARCSQARDGPAANAAAARPPDSTHIGHGGNARPTPPPAQESEATDTATHRKPSLYHRHHQKGEAAFPPPAKSQGFARRNKPMSEPIHISAAVLNEVANGHDQVADTIAAARAAGAEISAAVASYGPIMYQVKAAVADVLADREAALLEHDNRHRLAADELRRRARNYVDTDETNAGRLKL
jgi:hypothetical protein